MNHNEQTESAIKLVMECKEKKIAVLMLVEEVYEGKPGCLAAFAGSMEKGIEMLASAARTHPMFAQMLDKVALLRSNEKIDQLLKERRMTAQN